MYIYFFLYKFFLEVGNHSLEETWYQRDNSNFRILSQTP